MLSQPKAQQSYINDDLLREISAACDDFATGGGPDCDIYPTYFYDDDLGAECLSVISRREGHSDLILDLDAHDRPGEEYSSLARTVLKYLSDEEHARRVLRAKQHLSFERAEVAARCTILFGIDWAERLRRRREQFEPHKLFRWNPYAGAF